MHKNLINKMIAIMSRQEERTKQGADPLDAEMQASMEAYLLMMEKDLSEHIGQIFIDDINTQMDSDFYSTLLCNLDLPPDVIALLITPTFSETRVNAILS